MKRRYDYLLIAGFCALFSFLLLLGMAQAETTLYATLHGAGAGYDLGAGIRLEHTTRWGAFGLHGMARAAWQEKHGASQGYTAGAIAQARGYYRDFYAGVGYGVCRYRSEFEDGKVWAKQAWQPHVQVGYDSDRYDVWASYYFEEHDTPNQVEAIKVGGAMKIYGQVKLLAEISRMEFWQSGRRENDILTTLGIGWEF